MPAVATSITPYYGEMANPFLAKIVGMDLVNLYANAPGMPSDNSEKENLNIPNFSESYFKNTLGQKQILLLRQENRLLIVHYSGNASLKDHAEEFAALFAQTYKPL